MSTHPTGRRPGPPQRLSRNCHVAPKLSPRATDREVLVVAAERITDGYAAKFVTARCASSPSNTLAGA